MKKKKRILRTVISTMLMCCMLVGDLGSVFATSVGSSVVSEQQNEAQGSGQDVQTLAEPIEEPDLGMQSEQASDVPEAPVVEEPKVEVESEVKPEVEVPVETPEVNPEVAPKPTPEAETEQPEVKPEVENPVEQPEVNSEPEVKPVEKPSDSVPSEQPEANVPSEEPAEPSVETTTPSETDNWSLDLVFYDSTVDGGRTPLKSIDWDASDGGYSEEYKRDITVQINYKNNNVLKDYEPGSVCFKINNLMYGVEYDNKENLSWSSNIGANDSTHTGYFWDYSDFRGNTYLSSSVLDMYFRNAEKIEKGSNFEGSIQVIYSIVSKKEFIGTGGSLNNINREKEDFCVHSFNNIVNLFYNEEKQSSLNFNYIRKYSHIWNYKKASHSQKIKNTPIFDIPAGIINDNYWVKVTCSSTNVSTDNGCSYPNKYITDSNSYYLLKLPENCVVYNLKGNILEKEENGYKVSLLDRDSFSVGECSVIIGFPKKLFDTLKDVKIQSSLYGSYYGKNEKEFFNTETNTINLSDYDVELGELYSFSKKDVTSYDMRYQDIVNSIDNGRNSADFHLKSECVYTGEDLTVKFGDDLLYSTDQLGNLSKLSDLEYNFNSIYLKDLMKSDTVYVQDEKYDCELWVRYANNKEYVLFDSFKNNIKNNWSFKDTDNNVVGFYFVIKDVSESIKLNSTVRVNFCKKDIPESGTLRNYGFLQVFTKNLDGELVLKNIQKEDSYNKFLNIKEDLIKHDLNTYNSLVQRADGFSEWFYFKLNCGIGYTSSGCSGSPIIQDSKNNEFVGTSTSAIVFNGWRGSSFQKEYLSQVPDERYYKGGYLYDILPEGVTLLSSEKEILSSIRCYSLFAKKKLYNGCDSSIDIYRATGDSLSGTEFENIIKKRSTVNIIKNWNGTGRTKIELKTDFSDTPIFLLSNSNYDLGIGLEYKFSIPYDSYISIGNNFNQMVYTEPIFRHVSYMKPEYGQMDSMDINNNGKTDEYLSFKKRFYDIKSIVSTHQDVQTSVQTDKSNYSTGLVKASPESEYTYKLRARSGSNQVSNLVLVNNIEEGYGDNEHWKGEFLGIDTSFAENRTYRVYKPSDPRADAEGYVQERVQVKPYYSTSTTEGELYRTEEKVITDPSGQQITQRVRVVDEHGNFVKNPNWLEYSDSVDRGTVKSLAFEFLDAETGEQAILPENNLIYVEVKMKAPVEDDGLTTDGKAKYAYNNCFTQWNALDSMGQAVDFITGINSNTVKVTVNDRVSVQINKVWEDEENKYNTRPDTVEFIMKKDGKEVDRQTLEKGKTTVTFSGLLVDELSSYTFEEVCPSGYTTEGVIYDKVADTYTATNVLDPSSLVEINGTKTWVGDLESERPESITVNLYRNNEKIDSKVVRASDGWSYDFGKFVKNDPDGNEYVYRIEEEPVEGYIASYASAENGLNITFNSQCKTESDRYDYVEIYYKGSDDKTYKLGKWGGTALAGKVVGVPSKDFWLYWRTDGSDSNYYGFSIDSIESANVEATGTVATLPNYAVEEVSGSTYPDSAFDGHTHGNYGNSVNKVWHYTTGEDGFNITNTSNMMDIEGTKYWEDAETIHPESIDSTMESTRPASITVNLLQDGKQFMSTTTDESKGWEYSFRVPKLDENGREYVYTVREVPVEGYIDSYYEGNGSRITFSNDSRTESSNLDYVEIYYKKDGKTYKAGRWGGTTIAGASVTIPAKDFYLYWKTDSSGNNYYGYSVDSVVGVECSEVVGTVATIPDIGVVDTSSVEDLQSKHAPYLDNDKKLFKYWGNWLSRYDIENTLNLTEISGTKHWVGDTEDTRPASITINLLQDGKQIDSVTTDASKGWQYSFTAPKFDDTGRSYAYYVEEEPVEGYRVSYSESYGNGSRITFSDMCETEGKNWDNVTIYYKYNNNIYKYHEVLGGNGIAGKVIDIPSKEFYIYWKTDSSGSNYYGYKVDSIHGIIMDSVPEGDSITALPLSSYKNAYDVSELQSSHNPYENNVEELWKYRVDNGDLYDITNTLDNIELRFEKVFNMGTFDSMMGFQHEGISFTLYENTLESGYPEAYPGTSDEWRKVGELNKYEVGGDRLDVFLNEYYIDGLKSNKEYFLVENVDNLMVNYYGYPDENITAGYNVSTASIEDSCYVVRTGLGTIDNIFLTVYGYSNGTEYKPLYKENFRDFCDYYGGYTEGTNLHSFLDYTSSKYPTIPSHELFDSLQPMGFEGEWVIPNVLESKRIGVTKKIKASDINFDNGNPTFIFEARVPRYAGYDLKSVESGFNDDLDVLDIKHVEFTKEYVEANTDSEGYVSKTVYFDKIKDVAVLIAERVNSRYSCSSVTVDSGYAMGSGVFEDMGFVLTGATPLMETNVTFTNEKYENQYYSHNDIVVNEIKRNKTSSRVDPK